MKRLELPAPGRAEHVRLWLSYQRYGLVLTTGSVGLVATAVAFAPWWVWAPLAVLALWPLRFGAYVLSRWPRKLRATRIAMLRLARGTFRTASIRPYCGDPCFRVVADEILARSHLARAERRALIRRYARELEADGRYLVLVDHVGGTVFTVAGDGPIRSDSLHGPTTTDEASPVERSPAAPASNPGLTPG